MDAGQLEAYLKTRCPVAKDSVKIGEVGDKSSWQWQPDASATPPQINAANAAVAAASVNEIEISAVNILRDQSLSYLGLLPLNSATILWPLSPKPVNLTSATALTSGQTHFLYLGAVVSKVENLQFRCDVTVAGVAMTWAEVAVFTGDFVLGAGTLLTRLGFADVRTVFNSVGRKTINIPLTGMVAGTSLWLAYGSQATTTRFQLRGTLADDLQTGVIQIATVRPSLAIVQQPVTLAGPTVIPGWIVGVV